MRKIAGLILTLNEEINIEECIDSLDFVNEVFVFDSFSTDRTIELAKQKGAIVKQRKFDNYAAQRNAAFESIPREYDWIIMLDADERVTPALKIELQAELFRENNPIFMYRLRRKDHFMGRWIKHSSGYPTWFGRVFKNGKVQVQREINEEYHTDGEVGHLKKHLLHYPFSKGMDWWFSKHNRYSTMEANALLEEVKGEFKINTLFSTDPIIRRRAQKQLAFRLPFRPQIVFWALFLLRRGFLDGKAGYTFCRLRKTYEWMIDMKVKEMKMRHSNKEY